MEALISLILFALASMCNAVMDTLKFHFETSIFAKKDPKWWNPNISWQYVGFIKFTKYRPDAWHLVKSSMIIFICASTAILLAYKPIVEWYYVPTYFVLLGCVWNGTFNLFFNHILKLKK